MDATTILAEESKRIQSSGVLGEAKMRRLFDYLVGKTLAGQSPKEITIAIEVFDKTADFDVSQDALVRVYIHKLRKALDDFYASQSAGSLTSLYIPRGEYRLSSKSPNRLPATAVPESAPVPARRTGIQTIGLLGAGALAALLIAFAGARLRSSSSELDRVRSSPLWSAVINDDRPILIVVGDYYLIGETDQSMEVKRLIREYTVNSRNDLEQYLKEHPDAAARYTDVGLRYLPTSVAFAMRDIMPILGIGGRRINLGLVSDLTPAALKSTDIIYIGYMSGLGILQQLVFSGSRFSIGQSYDELLDTKTQRAYISQTASQRFGAPPSSGTELPYRDYGLLSSIRGPSGNTIVVIAGTRDEGVRQTAEAATNPAKLTELGRLADTSLPFDALFEVSALDGVNLSGKLLLEFKR